MSEKNQTSRLLAYLLAVFNSVSHLKEVEPIQSPDEPASLKEADVAILKTLKAREDVRVMKREVPKPVAFGILTHSGHIAGSAVLNPLSHKNSDAHNPIALALQNLEELKALPIKVDFQIATIAVTVDVCPTTGQPVDFDWAPYPDHLQLLNDKGIREILLVAPENGQSRYMALDMKLYA